MGKITREQYKNLLKLASRIRGKRFNMHMEGYNLGAKNVLDPKMDNSLYLCYPVDFTYIYKFERMGATGPIYILPGFMIEVFSQEPPSHPFPWTFDNPVPDLTGFQHFPTKSTDRVERNITYGGILQLLGYDWDVLQDHFRKLNSPLTAALVADKLVELAESEK